MRKLGTLLAAVASVLFFGLLLLVVSLHRRDPGMDAASTVTSGPPEIRADSNPHPSPAVIGSGVSERHSVLRPSRKTEKPRHRVRAVFRGNHNIPNAVLEGIAQSFDARDPSEYRRALTNRLMETYRASGFLRAKVVAEPNPLNLSEILISIQEGKPYTWGEVRIASEALRAKEAGGFFNVEKGRPANFAELKQMINAYVQFFEEQGYLDCSFIPEMFFDDTLGQVNLRLRMEEGLRYTVDRVSLNTPNAQALFSQLQGQFFNPSLYRSLVEQSGLGPNDISFELDRSNGKVSIIGRVP